MDVQINDASILIPKAARFLMTESGMFVDPFVDVIVPADTKADSYAGCDPFDRSGASAAKVLVQVRGCAVGVCILSHHTTQRNGSAICDSTLRCATYIVRKSTLMCSGDFF